MLEMARWQAESSAAKPPAVTGALQWLKSLQHSAQNMVSGRSDDALEDAEYIKVHVHVTLMCLCSACTPATILWMKPD